MSFPNARTWRPTLRASTTGPACDAWRLGWDRSSRPAYRVALLSTSTSRASPPTPLSVAIVHRVASSARRGLTFRSWNNASCLRRKRFSAAKALWECAARRASRTRSTTTNYNVRTQCATAMETDERDINAQDCTLQRVTGARFRFARSSCGVPCAIMARAAASLSLVLPLPFRSRIRTMSSISGSSSSSVPPLIIRSVQKRRNCWAL